MVRGVEAAPRIIGYCRVSTIEQADSGLGLAAQQEALEREAAYRGWDLQIIRDEGRTGASLRRAGIRRALRAIACGDADGLAVAKLDRLSRSSADTVLLADWFREADAQLAILDLGLDTSTMQGAFTLTVMAGVAQLEREQISQRTKASLAQLRRQGKPISRRAVHDTDLAARVRRLHAAGHSLAAIARMLNDEGVPTLRGGAEWRGSALQAVVGYQRPRKRHQRSTLPPVKGRKAGRR